MAKKLVLTHPDYPHIKFVNMSKEVVMGGNFAHPITLEPGKYLQWSSSDGGGSNDGILNIVPIGDVKEIGYDQGMNYITYVTHDAVEKPLIITEDCFDYSLLEVKQSGYDEDFITWLVYDMVVGGYVNAESLDLGYFTYSIGFMLSEIISLDELHWFYLFVKESNLNS